MKLLLTFITFCYLFAVCLPANAANGASSVTTPVTSPSLPKQTALDTATIKRIIQKAENYFETYPDSSLHYAKAGLQLSHKSGYKPGVADAHLQIALSLMLKSDYTSARLHLDSASTLYKHLKDGFGFSECLINKARIDDFLGNYRQAINILTQALHVRKSTGNEKDIAGCYAIMGITYDNMGQFAKALDCYFKALAIDLKHKDELAAADNYCNIGVVMQHLALYDKSIIYSRKALKLWEKLSDRQGISTAVLNIGEVLLIIKKYQLAAVHLFKAAAMFTTLDDKEGIGLAYTDIGLYYHNTHKPDSAVFYLNKGLESANKSNIEYNKAYAYLSLAQFYNSYHHYKQAYNFGVQAYNISSTIGSLDNRAKATLQLSIALAGLKHYAAAFNKHYLYTALTDSLKDNESVQRLMSHTLELDFQQRQNKLLAIARKRETQYQKRIEAQKQTALVSFAAIVLLSGVAITYYREKRKQQNLNLVLEGKNSEITKHKQDLDQLNTLKDKLISILAHDLRAPLSTLRGLFDLIKDDSITEAEFLTMVPKVAEKLNATSDFLDTLLFWINSQVKGGQTSIVNCTPSSLIATEITHIAEMAKQKNINVTVDVSDDLSVKADPNALRIVIRNLLINAVKFSNPSGQITVTVGPYKPGLACFAVKDNGVGIPPGRLNTLFKDKVLSTAGTASETGTGMGLYLCKDLIEKNSGLIWAESMHHTGTTVYFCLPCATG